MTIREKTFITKSPYTKAEIECYLQQIYWVRKAIVDMTEQNEYKISVAYIGKREKEFDNIQKIISDKVG